MAGLLADKHPSVAGATIAASAWHERFGSKEGSVGSAGMGGCNGAGTSTESRATPIGRRDDRSADQALWEPSRCDREAGVLGPCGECEPMRGDRRRRERTKQVKALAEKIDDSEFPDAWREFRNGAEPGRVDEFIETATMISGNALANELRQKGVPGAAQCRVELSGRRPRRVRPDRGDRAEFASTARWCDGRGRDARANLKLAEPQRWGGRISRAVRARWRGNRCLAGTARRASVWRPPAHRRSRGPRTRTHRAPPRTAPVRRR